MKEFTEDERYNYDLNQSSLVVDAGAYHGQFSKRIWDKYGCAIWAYEPTVRFRDIALETLKGTGVLLYPFGLSDKDEMLRFGVANDSTGRFKESADVEDVVLVDANVLAIPEKIDLLKLNIEGGEYAVLRRLIDTGIIKKIRNVQVQFHRCAPDSDALVAALTEELAKTHHLTFDAGPYIWQNWEINQ